MITDQNSKDRKKGKKEAFTYLPTCLEAFSKNFVFEATLQKKKKTDTLVLFFINSQHVLIAAPFGALHFRGTYL